MQRPAGGTALDEQAPRHVPRGERTEQRMTHGGGVHLSRACSMLPTLGLLVLAWPPVMLGRVWRCRESGFAANIQQGVYSTGRTLSRPYRAYSARSPTPCVACSAASTSPARTTSAASERATASIGCAAMRRGDGARLVDQFTKVIAAAGATARMEASRWRSLWAAADPPKLLAT